MRKRGREYVKGYVNFLFHTKNEPINDIGEHLRKDLNSPDYVLHDLRMPISEMSDSFFDSYQYMAEECYNIVPGWGRGLMEGDWLILRSVTLASPTEHRKTPIIKETMCLVAAWRHKSCMRKYMSGFAWDTKSENGVYTLKPDYKKLL